MGGISVRRIQVLCIEGRIACAIKIGSYWAILEDVNKPKYKRIKNRKYMKIEWRIENGNSADK